MKTLSLFVVDNLLYSETEKALSESKAFVVMFPKIIFMIFFLFARWVFGTRHLTKPSDTNLV